MQRAITLVQAVSVAAILGFAAPASATTEGYRISGPAVHQNLAVYFIHGQGSAGPVPLTLQEALAKRAVRVHEHLLRRGDPAAGCVDAALRL